MGSIRNALRAWLGVTTAPAAIATREPMAIGLTAAGAITPEAPPVSQTWQLPKAPPYVKPEMAMDRAGNGGVSVADLYAWAMNGSFSEGLGFLGYPYLAELTQRPEYRRVSEIYAAEATRKGIKFSGDEERVKAIEAQFERFAVWPLLRRVVEMDGFYGRGQIFVDLGDDYNGPELQAPLVLKAKVQEGGLRGFQAVEPLWSYPGQYESGNPLHPDFYRPKHWYVMSTTVDSSRLITVTGRAMPDMLKPAYSFGGLSLSQMVKPYVDNWLRTRQSVSDLLHSFSTMVLSTDMSTVLSGGGADTLLRRLDVFNRSRDNRGVMAINKENEELSNVSTPLGTLDKLLAQAQEQISSACGIPLVILLGVTPSGLNASSDGEIRAFYDTVKAYQERVLREPLKTILSLVQLDMDGTIDPEVTFDFIDLWEMDEKDKAAIRKSDADMDVAYVGAGIVSNEEVRARIVEDEDSPYFGVDLSAEAPEPPDMGGELDDEGSGDDPEAADKPAQDAAGDFDEGKHPRAANGQFGSGGGGSSKVDHAAVKKETGELAAKHGREGAKTLLSEQMERLAGEISRARSTRWNTDWKTGEKKPAGAEHIEGVRTENRMRAEQIRNILAGLEHLDTPEAGPRMGKNGKPLSPHVVATLGDETVTKLESLIADKNSKARDILDALSPLDAASQSVTPTIAHNVIPPLSFWTGRKYADGMNISQAHEALVAKAESYASDKGGVGLKREKKARILLGPPAAGKSTSAEQIARTGGYAIVDGDDAKKVIPEFEGGMGASAVHEESSEMAGAVLDDMLSRGDNVILPLVGGSPGSIRARIERLKLAGYAVTVDLVDVNEDEAARRMASRALSSGRHISSSYFMSIGDGPLRTYETLKGEFPDAGFGRIDGNGGQKEETYLEATNHPDATKGHKLFG